LQLGWVNIPQSNRWGLRVTKLFISYSHKDESLRDALETHLSLLKNQGIVQVWYDRKIEAGAEFAASIDENLANSQIILLLVSPDFLASTYCWGIEMTQAMEMHKRKAARVIPVILRACDWRLAPFGQLLAAPKDGKPVKSWPDLDEALYDVARQIRTVIENSAANPPKNSTVNQLKNSIAANIYCSHCGAVPGRQSTCTGQYTHHAFAQFGKYGAICSRCGIAAGTQSTCTGQYTHHHFIDAGSSPAYCRRCGELAGRQSTCTGQYTHHEFDVPI
jgi:hypothetical protein